jgi:hypothetical protein
MILKKFVALIFLVDQDILLVGELNVINSVLVFKIFCFRRFSYQFLYSKKLQINTILISFSSFTSPVFEVKIIIVVLLQDIPTIAQIKATKRGSREN